MTAVVPMGPLTAEDARTLTDEVKQDAHALWTKLLRLFEGDAHKALGYRTWGQYYEAEFGGSAKEGNRMLAAGRVLESLEPADFRGEGSPGSPLLNERAARELQPLLRRGADAVRDAYEEAVELAGGEKPTARQVREVVQLHCTPPRAPEPPLTAPTPLRPAQTPPRPLAPVVEPEKPVDDPAWVARLDRFVSDLQWFMSGAHCSAGEIAKGAKGMLGELEIVRALLEELARAGQGA